MRALQLVGPEAPLELRDVPEPVAEDGDVVVQVAGCGVCHTDIGFWQDGVPTRHALPLTLGHEISGTVVEADPGHEGLLGCEVIVPAVIPCGRCDLCRSGRGNVCRSQKMPGNDMDGGFADRVRVPGSSLCLVDDRGGYDLAELSVVADAVTTPYQAVVRSGLQAGDLAIVVGAGGVGTYCVQIAAAFGAHVIALDVDSHRLLALEGHGMRMGLDPSEMDRRELKKTVGAAAHEWGAPPHSWKIFECSGNVRGQETAFGLLTHAAVLMVVGFTLDRGTFRLSNLMAFDATAQGSWGCLPELYPAALELITNGRITLRPFVEIHPLEQGDQVLQQVAAHAIRRRAILVPEA